MLALLIAAAHAQDCPDAAATLRDAMEQLILFDEDALASDLDEVEESLGCAWIDPESLATLWLLRGAQHQLEGDEDATRAAFAMAQFVAPDLWIDALGGPLRAIYDEEKAKARPRSQLDLTGVGDATVRIDGKVRQLPTPLTLGSHVLQVGTGDVVEERRDVTILAGQGAVVDLGRSAVVEAPPDKSSSDGDHAVGLSLWGAAGFGLTAGEAFDIDGQSEPAMKLAVPLEAGAVVELGPAWVRLQGGWAPLLGGSLLYLTGNEVKGAPGFLQVGGAGGASFAGFQAGALGAVTIPSRTSIRGLVGRDIVEPMGVELRGGVNLHPKRAAEPAVELLVRVQPSLF